MQATKPLQAPGAAPGQTPQQPLPAPPAAAAKLQGIANEFLQNLPHSFSKDERSFVSSICEKIKKRTTAEAFQVVPSGVTYDRQKEILNCLREKMLIAAYGFARSYCIVKVEEGDMIAAYGLEPSKWYPETAPVVKAQPAATPPAAPSQPLAAPVPAAAPAPAAAPTPKQIPVPVAPASHPAPESPDPRIHLRQHFPQGFTDNQKMSAENILTKWALQAKPGFAFGAQQIDSYLAGDERKPVLNLLVDLGMIHAYGLGRFYLIKMKADDKIPEGMIPPGQWIDKAARAPIIKFQRENDISLSMFGEDFLARKFPSEEQMKELKFVVKILNAREQNKSEFIGYKDQREQILQFLLEQQLIGGFDAVTDQAGNIAHYNVHPMKS